MKIPILHGILFSPMSPHSSFTIVQTSRIITLGHKRTHTLCTLITTQYPGTLNVWAGIVGQHILGPIVIEGKLTGEKCLQMLQAQISEQLDALQLPGKLWYQHEGCPVHNYGPALQFLHEAFPGQVIGTNEPLAWPVHSPDLTPLDYFLWGHIASSIYSNTPFLSLDALHTAIVQLNNVNHEFRTRLEHCAAADGHVFEHLL